MPEEEGEMDWDDFFSDTAGDVSNEAASKAVIDGRGGLVTPAFWDSSSLVRLCVQRQQKYGASALTRAT